MFTDYILNSKQWMGPTFKTDGMAKISICSKGMSIIGKVETEKNKILFFSTHHDYHLSEPRKRIHDCDRDYQLLPNIYFPIILS